MDNQPEKKLTLKQWQVRSRLSVEAFAQELKLDARILRMAILTGRAHKHIATRIIEGMNMYFACHHEYVGNYTLPASPSDIEGFGIK